MTGRKQSSSAMSTLASRLIRHADPEVRRLAASVLAQDETKGQEETDTREPANPAPEAPEVEHGPSDNPV